MAKQKSPHEFNDLRKTAEKLPADNGGKVSRISHGKDVQETVKGQVRGGQDFFSGGETGALIASMDWSATPLGPRDTWPESLCTVVNLILAGSFPMAILWGSNLIFIYNDAYRVIAGDRHPNAMGRSNREIWPEVWDFNKPVFERVMSRGETVHFEDQLFPIVRNGRMEDANFTLSYSPIFSEAGQVGGTLVVLVETTERIRAERELEAAHKDLEKKVEERTAQLQVEIAERKKAEEALRDSEKKYRALTENVPAVIQRFDRNLRVLYMAPQAVEATGIPLGEFIGKTNEELGMPPDLCATWNGLFHKVCASKQMQSVVFDFPGPKEIKTYLLKVVPEFAPDGSVESYLGISTDITEHKKAEDSIQQLLKSVQREKDRLLTLINSIPDEVWCFNADGTIELVNPPVVREFGGDLINLKEAAKLNDNSEIYQPDGQPRQAVDSPPLRALRGEVVVGQEEVVRAPSSGELRRRQVNASPVKDAEGNIVGAVAIVRDITERKRAEEELRRALAKAEEGRNTLDALMSHIPMGITIADAPDVKIRMISKQGQRIMDRAESEIAHIPSPLHPSRWGVYHADGVTPGTPEDLPLTRATVKGDIVVNEEWFVTRKDGTLVPILCNAAPIRDAEGNVVGGVIGWQDITERKRIEEEVSKSRDELEMRVEERTEALRRQADLLELAHNAILVRDLESRITFWNHGAEQVYGWTKAEALGNVTHTFLKTRSPMSLDEHMAILTKEGHWEGELEHTTKDGRNITVLSRWALQRDEAGKPAAILEINLDITEARRTEQQLRQAQKMEALGTLTGGVAHDFNNILAAIIGFTELVEDHVPKGSREAHHLKRVMESSLRGRDLVRQMLTYSRKTEQEKKPLSLSSIVKDTVKLIRATTPTTITIKIDTLRESGLILGDPTQMQQVVMNLCTNAAHAMREKGGTLDIQLSNHIVSVSDGDPYGINPGLYTKLTVRDTGTGMSPDIIDKIFDPFFTTKKLGEGTGLGLSVVHGIVKQSNGHIAVESEPGKGSTFTLYFPKVTGELEADATTDDMLPTGSESVLFIDDEEALVEMGEDILAELGYDVTSRMSSTEALALFKEDPSRFDLVITDQTMPEMTGFELAKEVLAIRADLPIIMCTGFSYVVNEDKAKAAGIKAFAMKPLTKREVAQTIRKVLDE